MEVSASGLPEKWEDLPDEWKQTPGMRNPEEYAVFKANQEQQSLDMAMAQAAPTKVAYTTNIRDIDALAAEIGSEGLNRRLSTEGLDSLDEEGVHLLKPIMVHRHAMGEPVQAHMRCLAYLKMDRTPEIEMMLGAELSDEEIKEEDLEETFRKPFEVFLDVPMAYFNSLPSVAEYRKIIGLPPEEDEQDDWQRFLGEFHEWAARHDPENPETRLLVPERVLDLDGSMRTRAHRG